MQEANLRFSIITPIYNVEKYLPECIDSILKQTFPCFELILVDDGSPDACPEICDCYAARDARVRVIHQKNGGLVCARKAGTRNSRGQYIINVDGDDRVEDTMLATIDAAIRKYGNPDMVSFGVKTITEEGEEINVEHERISEGEYSIEKDNIDLARSGFLLTDRKLGKERPSVLRHDIWSKAIKRELAIVMQEAVPNSTRLGEDAAVVIPSAYASNSIVVLHDILYDYRIRNYSMVRSFQMNQMERLMELIQFLRQAVPAFPEENYTCFIYRQIEQYLILAARSCTRYSEFRQAEEKCLAAGVNDFLDAYRIPKELKFLHRFRVWFTKRRWFWMYWLIYHRKW